jgi:HEAT repeat protein
MMGDGVIALQQPFIDQDIITWKVELNNRDGKIRLNAAYNLALCNEYNTLIERLYNNNEIFRFEAAYALTACRYNKDAITELQTVLKKEEHNENQAYCLAFIYSEMGSTAFETLPLLIGVMETSESWLVQQYCCEALGTIQSNEQYDADVVVRCLTNILTNRDQQKQASHTRFTAALSLAKLGAKAIPAIPILKDALYLDENRYVNGNALLALERIGTNEALKIVLAYLKMSRWCTKTTADSLY